MSEHRRQFVRWGWRDSVRPWPAAVAHRYPTSRAYSASIVPARVATGQAAVGAAAARAWALHARPVSPRVMRLAGRFADDSGGAMLFGADDEASAQAIVAADPAVVAQTFT